MIEGTVKWFNPEKGYGFIRPKKGRKDIFVHISQVRDAGYESLEEGDPVEFTIVEDEKGRKCVGELVVFEYVYE